MRAFTYLWGKAVWVMICYIIIKKGGLYLDVLTIGGMMLAFLTFIPMGIYRALLTMTSNLLGREKYSEIWRLCHSLVTYGCIIGIIVAIPLLLYPQTLVYFFDASLQEAFGRVFKTINHWMWLFVIAITVQMGLHGIIVALHDLKAQLYFSFISTLITLFPVYLTMQLLGWESDKLWLIMAMESVIIAFFFFYRLRLGKWKNKELPLARAEGD
jgi:Na+-driven multidrug efflux pump